MKMHRWTKSVCFLLAASFASPGNSGAAPHSAGTVNLSLTQRRVLESDIATLVADVAKGNRLLAWQSFGSKPKVTYDTGTKVLTIDLGRAALPKVYTPELDDQLLLIQTNVVETLGSELDIAQVDFLFGGNDLFHFFPEQRGPSDADLPKLKAQAVGDKAPVMVISAGSGMYRHLPSDAQPVWQYQRPPIIQGRREDLLMVEFAKQLEKQMMQRSGDVTTHQARSTSTRLNPDTCSGSPVTCQPWYAVASRYHLQNILPNRPDIWQSYQPRTSPQVERYDDIRARPLYANSLGADQLISLHTNAISNDGDPQTIASGTRVYTQTDRPSALPLAKNIACAMQESIRTDANYPNWTAQTFTANFGENRLAVMPSVLVEVAFGDNPNDAAALLDKRFQVLAARGMEKGARLTREGKTCDPAAPPHFPHQDQ